MNLIDKIYEKISYRSRLQKRLLKFNGDLQKYLQMPEDEFTLEYIEIEAKYEHKKMMFTVVSVTFLISIVMNIWKYLYNLLKELLNLKVIVNSANTKPVEFLVIFFIIIIFVVALLIIIDLSRNLYTCNKKRLVIEESRSIRQRAREENGSI